MTRYVVIPLHRFECWTIVLKYMYILYPAIQQRIRGLENGSVFIGKDCLVKCLAMSLMIELINHVKWLVIEIVRQKLTCSHWYWSEKVKRCLGSRETSVNWPTASSAVFEKKVAQLILWENQAKFPYKTANESHKIHIFVHTSALSLKYYYL